jgi:hypothetical protein
MPLIIDPKITHPTKNLLQSKQDNATKYSQHKDEGKTTEPVPVNPTCDIF